MDISGLHVFLPLDPDFLKKIGDICMISQIYECMRVHLKLPCFTTVFPSRKHYVSLQILCQAENDFQLWLSEASTVKGVCLAYDPSFALL